MNNMLLVEWKQEYEYEATRDRRRVGIYVVTTQHYAPNDRAVSLAGGRRRESALAFDWTGFEARDFWQGQNTVTT